MQYSVVKTITSRKFAIPSQLSCNCNYLLWIRLSLQLLCEITKISFVDQLLHKGNFRKKKKKLNPTRKTTKTRGGWGLREYQFAVPITGFFSNVDGSEHLWDSSAKKWENCSVVRLRFRIWAQWAAPVDGSIYLTPDVPEFRHRVDISAVAGPNRNSQENEFPLKYLFVCNCITGNWTELSVVFCLHQRNTAKLHCKNHRYGFFGQVLSLLLTSGTSEHWLFLCFSVPFMAFHTSEHKRISFLSILQNTKTNKIKLGTKR